MAVFAQYAPEYASQGWQVFPLNGKKPMIQGWPEKATTEPGQIQVWARQWPAANVGIKTGRESGLLVIDIDGEIGEQSLHALMAQHGSLPNTRQAVTGKGRHLYFAYPAEIEIRNDAGRKLGSGIDVRGEGGYVVAPGSVHPENGRLYQWLSPQVKLAEPPDWLIALLVRQQMPPEVRREIIPLALENRRMDRYAHKALEQARSQVMEAPNGARNHTLNREAYSMGQLVAAGALSEGEARATLEDAAQAAGLGCREIVRTIQSGMQAGQKSPRDLNRIESEALKATATREDAVYGDDPLEWPDPQPLPDSLPSVKPFDPAMLPQIFRPWLEDIAERMQCPIDFPAIGAMVVLASVVGRQIGIRPKATDDWTVVPNLWGAIIGRPGLMKTPTLTEAMKPLVQLEQDAAKDYREALRQWEASEMVAKEARKLQQKDITTALKKKGDANQIAMAALAEDEKPEPVRKRYQVNDTTVEKLGEILAGNPNGVLLYRDELTGFLRSLDKQGQEGSRAFYLESWNGSGRFTFDRIGRGTVDIEAACVSILGSIQPGPLSAYLQDALRSGAGDDGLLQRFQMLVWPDNSRQWRNVDREPNRQARLQAYGVIEYMARLESGHVEAGCDLDGGIPYLRFDAEAQGVFTAWLTSLEHRLRSDEEHPALEAHLSKYRGLIPSLALLIHLADGGHGPVGLEALQKACAWGTYLESHARRVYAVGLGSNHEGARRLLKQIKQGKLPNQFTVRDVYRHGWSGLANEQAAKDAVELLEDHGYLRLVSVNTAGRPREEVHVNPKAAGGGHGQAD